MGCSGSKSGELGKTEAVAADKKSNYIKKVTHINPTPST